MLALISSWNDITRRDFSLADVTLCDPDDADCIEAGEWVTLDSSGNIIRCTGDPSTNPLAYQVLTEKGDTAAQALGKLAVIQMGEYEAETDQFVSTTFAVGDYLAIETESLTGATRAVLSKASTNEYVRGICTKTPATNGGLLRFQRVTVPFKMP